MVYLDFRSLCLIIAMRRVGRRLVPYRRRFTLTEPHRCHAARGPRRLVLHRCKITLSLADGCLAALVAATGRGGCAGGGVGGRFYAR